MSKSQYDVVIAGAGPAGCAAAIRLRQLQLTVCLVDDVNPNALKVGESLPGAGIRLLNRLGVDRLDQILTAEEFQPCVANVSAWGTEEWTYNDSIRNPEGGGWHLVRHRFEAALRKLAQENGADLIPSKVGKVAWQEEEKRYQLGFKTKKEKAPETLEANWLIDASGRAGALLKQLQLPRLTFETQLAAVAWFQPNAADTDSTTRIKSVEKGWWYSSKIPDGTRVISFHGLAAEVAHFVKAPDQFITSANNSGILQHSVETEHLIQGVTARDASVSRAQRSIVSNCLAIGDAALSFDPLSSQGMFFALYSAVRGAESIADIISDPTREAHSIQNYELKVENVFQANQNSRRYYYSLEQRFQESEYWGQYG